MFRPFAVALFLVAAPSAPASDLPDVPEETVRPETELQQGLRATVESEKREQEEKVYVQALQLAIFQVKRECGPIRKKPDGKLDLFVAERSASKRSDLEGLCVDFWARLGWGRVAHFDCQTGRIDCAASPVSKN